DLRAFVDADEIGRRRNLGGPPDVGRRHLDAEAPVLPGQRLACRLHLGEEEEGPFARVEQFDEEIKRLGLFAQEMRSEVGERSATEVHDAGAEDELAAAADLVPRGHLWSPLTQVPSPLAFYRARANHWKREPNLHSRTHF